MSEAAEDTPSEDSGAGPNRTQSVVAWALMAGLLLIPAAILLIVLNQ